MSWPFSTLRARLHLGGLRQLFCKFCRMTNETSKPRSIRLTRTFVPDYNFPFTIDR